VSAFDDENEVVVNGPSSWEVVAATMTPTGTLVVVIKRLPDFVTFLTQQDDVHVTVAAAAAAAASSPAAASSAAASSSTTTTSSSSAAVDPSLQPLTDALVALKIGVPSACAALAAALGQEGVMGIDDLRLFPETKARELLARVGLKEMQQLKLMQAVVQSPPPPQVTRPSPCLACDTSCIATAAPG
jgi:hypothetical protein